MINDRNRPQNPPRNTPYTTNSTRAVPPQARYWILTIPYETWTPPTSLGEHIQYERGQGEIGASGFQHWQVLVSYKEKKSLAQVKRDFTPGTHAEPTRSDAAREYVWKEETRIPDTQFELGTPAIRVPMILC